ncbi:MAG: GAF domain-containing protein [Vicinamibacterales bacterium]
MNQFLSDSQRLLASADSTPAILQRVARAAVPLLADFCFIFLVRNGDVPCVASAHATPEGERLLRRLNRVYRVTRDDPVSTVAQVVRTARPRLRSEIGHEPKTPGVDLRIFTLHQRLGVRSALVVPIGSSPDVLGAISLSYAESGRRFTRQDIPIVNRLASLVAAFLIERRRLTASPPPPPLTPRRPIRLRARA